MASSADDKVSVLVTQPSQVLDPDEAFVARDRTLTVSKIRGELKKNTELNSKKAHLLFTAKTL